MATPQGNRIRPIGHGARVRLHPHGLATGLATLFLVSLLTPIAIGSPIHSPQGPVGTSSSPSAHSTKALASDRWATPREGATARPAVSGAPGVVSTLDLVTNELFPGNRLPAVQDGPQFGLYDPNNGRIYVRGDIGQTISVVDPTSHTVITAIAAQADQTAYALLPTLAVDPVTGLLYAANFNEGNVSVIDPTTNAIIGSIPVDNGPYGLTYDPDNGNFYVTGFSDHNVTVFSGSTDRTVANITVGSEPTDILYDPIDREIYVANFNSRNVSVINTTQEKVVASLPVGTYPSGLALDPTDDFVDVAAANGGGQSNVTILNGHNDTVRGVVAVGDGATSLVYANASGGVFVANGASNNVSVIRQPADTVVKTLHVGLGATDIALDPSNNLLYVANSQSSNISILNAASEDVVGTVPTVNYPYWSIPDPANGRVYSVNGGSSYTESNLTILDNTSVATPVGSIALAVYPAGLVYDPDAASIFAGDPGGSSVYQVGPTANQVTSVTPVGLYPKHLTYDTTNHDLYVLDRGSENVTVLNASLHPIASVPVGIGPSGIAFDASNGCVYVTDDYGGNVTVIDGSTNLVTDVITIKPYDDLTTVFYDPHSTRVLVADASGKNLTVINGNTDALVGSIPVGSEPESLAYDSLNHTVFVANGGSGNLSVINDTLDRVVRSIPVYSAGFLAYDPSRDLVIDSNLYSPAAYAVNASNYSVWPGEIYLGGAQAPTGIAYDPSTQETVIASEYDDVLSILGTPVASYAINFHESGLPNGTGWSVVLGGISNSSSTPSIGFETANGSAHFTVGTVPGFTVNRSAGSVTVAGLPVVVDLTFTATALLGGADFTETGLPVGAAWNVTFDGVEEGSTTTAIDFLDPDGTYAYSIAAVGVYEPTPASGDLTVVGTGTTPLAIAFVPHSTGPAKLAVTLTATPSTFVVGNTTVLTAIATGGSGGYSYAYTGLPAGCATANASSLSCTPSGPGDSNVTVTVTDSAGATAHNVSELLVEEGSPVPPRGTPATSGGTSPLPGWAWGVLLVVAAVALGAGVLIYRRGRKDRPPPSTGTVTDTSPPMGPPPPAS